MGLYPEAVYMASEEQEKYLSGFIKARMKEREQVLSSKVCRKCKELLNLPKKRVKETSEFKEELKRELNSDELYQAYLSHDYSKIPKFEVSFAKYVRKAQKRELQEHYQKIWDEWKNVYLDDILEQTKETALREITTAFEEMLSNDTLTYEEEDYSFYHYRTMPCPVTKENLEDFINMFVISPENFISHITGGTDCLDYLFDIAIDSSQKLEEFCEPCAEECDSCERSECYYRYKENNVFPEYDLREILNFEIKSGIYESLSLKFTREKVVELMRKNPHYAAMFDEIEEEKRREELLQQEVIDSIPENIIDLYPLARCMHRHFHLHIGPTNSGKTYHALNCLKEAQNGVYLAPLRLMAFETYETLNSAGIACDMKTGEEEILVENSNISSMTIELLDLSRRYDIAVIDEAQMVEDFSRGGAWTDAILGVAAEEVHVCMAPEAQEVVLNLIQLCGDSYTVHEYTRKTELLRDDKHFNFPEDVEKHDALIVFSKAKVLAVAAELQNNGKKCSVIYGSLPYEARHAEVERFKRGKTDIVVSTDAIGMGINVPVRRIIFLETKKFDGKTMRTLTDSEIKQIAGRAGRFGQYEKGYYLSELPYFNKKLYSAVESSIKPIRHAYLGFPMQLLKVNGILSDTIEQWNQTCIPNLFKKQSLTQFYELAKNCEQLTDNKMLVYRYATTPFDTSNGSLMYLFHKFFMKIVEECEITLHDFYNLDSNYMPEELNDLEEEYKKLDLLYNLFRKAEKKEFLPDILKKKKDFSCKISKILTAQALKPRKCKFCGKPLPWNYPYGMCENCHDERFY